MNPADCGSLDEKECCANYYWSDKENDCLPCELGFFGVNCDQPCPYGQYGKLCGKPCKCATDEYCDRVSGCVTNVSTEVIQNTFVSSTSKAYHGQFNRNNFLQSTHFPGPVTYQTSTHSAGSEGTTSRLIIINGSVIVALLIVLIIIVSVKKFLVFKYNTKNVEQDTDPLATEELAHSEVFEIEECDKAKTECKSSRKQTKSRYKEDAIEENDTLV